MNASQSTRPVRGENRRSRPWTRQSTNRRGGARNPRGVSEAPRCHRQARRRDGLSACGVGFRSGLAALTTTFMNNLGSARAYMATGVNSSRPLKKSGLHVKWQMVDGKTQGFFHLPFLICHSGCVFQHPARLSPARARPGLRLADYRAASPSISATAESRPRRRPTPL
jgi:hypothetical protein